MKPDKNYQKSKAFLGTVRASEVIDRNRAELSGLGDILSKTNKFKVFKDYFEVEETGKLSKDENKYLKTNRRAVLCHLQIEYLLQTGAFLNLDNVFAFDTAFSKKLESLLLRPNETIEAKEIKAMRGTARTWFYKELKKKESQK